MYDKAYAEGSITDARWKNLVDENAKPAVKEAGNILARDREAIANFY